MGGDSKHAGRARNLKSASHSSAPPESPDELACGGYVAVNSGNPETQHMKWSGVLIPLIAIIVVLCSLTVLRYVSRQGRLREREEMRRHVRRNYS
jgi:hypothetical protein